MNPIYWWWRVKEGGPYTKYGTYHINPLCKIVAFSMKNMLHLQACALIGQFSKLLDKGLRPVVTSENWWDIWYYSIFSVIHLRQIFYILQDQRPIQFEQDDLELYELVFQNNQFSPRQFDKLRALASKRQAKAGTLLVPPGQAIRELTIVVKGECEVMVGGHRANVIRPGGFLGELEFLQGEEKEKEKEGVHEAKLPEGNSTFDMLVRARSQITYFSWNFEVLEKFLRKSENKQVR
ncbi:hypothetical protein GUITHDRAFT_131925 [Guillardia theta CCMP2712]|uniref:Cyclic nucleotide-binding domain-containing protein n=1 Tax=Guillardia theta (strain CCMP2712) TaxID=905079 RepID=L1K3L4_GUITC|nr:hypothetical protein GUITHDRAFT_131925 [Guillardia theta CCMP2712]EKX54953.1 hypothetical protein GUITHDRAFT_131925 [Guillardia theta CCMP2712]|eukprot:XP_005841933.1 hypothetical protein GUITHDRAFT_131925 [Guillardia theta CCMP2712]